MQPVTTAIYQLPEKEILSPAYISELERIYSLMQ